MLNGETRRRLVEALGELTIQNISNGARADICQNQLAQAEADYEKLAAGIGELRTEIETLRGATAIPDVSKLDFDTLALELKHRGYEVTAASGGRSSEEVEPTAAAG